jgi:glycosyltransferase involved in cell wall biosynthesis
MKRILAVSWDMPPMYGPRASQVSRTVNAFAGRGWQVTVIAMAPRRGGPNWPDGRDAETPAPGVELRRVASPEDSLAVRALWRLAPWTRWLPDEKRVWVPAATRAALQAAASNTFDVLVTFAQPWSDHLVGLRVHAATRLPWVAHFSDPWVDSPWIGSRYVPGSAWHKRQWAQWERSVIESAGAVVFVNTQTADLVMRKYPDAWRAKAAVVPHGFARSHAPPHAPARRDGRLRIVYTGRFYTDARTPDSFLQALARLRQSRNLDDRLSVSMIGPFVTEYRERASALGVGDLVEFHDRRPPDEALRTAGEADVLLVIDAPSRGPSVFLPSKLVDYLMFGKPILGVTPPEGATADLLRRLECPIAPPEDPVAIAAAVAQLLDRHEAGTLRVSDAFTRVAAEFDIAETTARFERVLDETLGAARG